ncbi:MAG TPA: dienelactone hydrolase family protein [Flavisolibacter sp.]|nr:dienelactone hydrolase family protein [Flavisolibacter sp.]
MLSKPILVLAASLCLFASCNEQDKNATAATDNTKDSTSMNKTDSMGIKEEAVSYDDNGTTLKGYVAYNGSSNDRKPIVLVVPEWWGVTEYPRMRAQMLAEMGYFAMTVDMYGNGKLAENPKDATEASRPYYDDPALAKSRLDAALQKAKTFAQADTAKVAAIGYCFGGSMVLNYAKMGAPVAGVVSFHGGLQGVAPQKGTKAQFLICHGNADTFVPDAQVKAFRKSMDSAGLSYTFKTYDNATHAFTNPAATAKGQQFNLPLSYNGPADTASWNEMKTFLNSVLR